jgi:hypothetical protein
MSNIDVHFQADAKALALWQKAAKADGRSLSAMLRKAANREATMIMTWAAKVNAPAKKGSKHVGK